MDQCAGVLFQRDGGDTYAQKLPAGHERLVVLRDLVALRQVGVEIVLAVEFADRRDFAAQGQADLQDVLHGLLVDGRQGTRVAEAHRADVHVRTFFLWVIQAVAKHPGLGLQLRMDLQADGRDVFHMPLLYVVLDAFPNLSGYFFRRQKFAAWGALYTQELLWEHRHHFLVSDFGLPQVLDTAFVHVASAAFQICAISFLSDKFIGGLGGHVEKYVDVRTRNTEDAIFQIVYPLEEIAARFRIFDLGPLVPHIGGHVAVRDPHRAIRQPGLDVGTGVETVQRVKKGGLLRAYLGHVAITAVQVFLYEMTGGVAIAREVHHGQFAAGGLQTLTQTTGCKLQKIRARILRRP